VKIGAPTCGLDGEQLARRLIGSIVDDHKLANWVSLRINRRETSFKERWAVPRYDDCRYSYHEHTSLVYQRLEIIVPEAPFSFNGLRLQRG
jgi:hypothetical protein